MYHNQNRFATQQFLWMVPLLRALSRDDASHKRASALLAAGCRRGAGAATRSVNSTVMVAKRSSCKWLRKAFIPLPGNVI